MDNETSKMFAFLTSPNQYKVILQELSFVDDDKYVHFVLRIQNTNLLLNNKGVLDTPPEALPIQNKLDYVNNVFLELPAD